MWGFWDEMEDLLSVTLRSTFQVRTCAPIRYFSSNISFHFSFHSSFTSWWFYVVFKLHFYAVGKDIFVKWMAKNCWKTSLLSNVLTGSSSLFRSVILGWPLHIQYDEFFFLFDCKDVMIKGQNKYCLFQPVKKKRMKDETIFLKQHDSMQKWCLCL